MSKASLQAQKKYDIANKNKYKPVYLKLNKESDRDIIERLDQIDNIQGYIKKLIRNDK